MQGTTFFSVSRAVVLACLALSVISAAPASAAEPIWKCRASAGYVIPVANPLVSRVEPLVANGSSDPKALDRAMCVDDDAGPNPVAAAGALELTAASARTRNVEELAAVNAQQLSADAKVASTKVSTLVSAKLLEAHADARCDGGKPVLTGSSTVDELVIGGQSIPIPPGSAPMTIPTPAVTVYLNEEVRTDTELVRRALRVVLAGGAGEAVVAEAKVTAPVGVCSNTGAASQEVLGLTNSSNNSSKNSSNSSNSSNSNQICPNGSTYDQPSNRCVIRQSGGSVIVVGRPGDVPVGGTVMTLPAARKLTKSGHCLVGKGPAFAIVGTNKRDRITGTNKRDRIVTRGGKDNVEGGRGDDCIYGGNGSDTLSGALGKDRLIGGSGNDHLIGGSHRDVLGGGRGNDSINAGYGGDRVDGGPGNDAINVATAGPAARVKCGKGHDKLRGNRNERKRVRGCEKRYFLR